MAELIDLKTFVNDKGKLTVIEKILPFEIKRVFFIYGVDDSVRGKHRHKKTIQAAICMQGSCKILNQTGDSETTQSFILDGPAKCLLLHPEDFHWMKDFTKDCILMVLASEFFDPGDYIFESYRPIL